MSESLTTAENSQLVKYEQAIAAGMKTFAEVGTALLAIRDARLYRASHATFEAYCREKWRMTKTHANRLVSAAEVVINLAPIGAKPTTESQARPLAQLPAAEQPQAWKEATDKAAGEGREVTARDVQEVVSDHQQDKPVARKGRFGNGDRGRRVFAPAGVPAPLAHALAAVDCELQVCADANWARCDREAIKKELRKLMEKVTDENE